MPAISEGGGSGFTVAPSALFSGSSALVGQAEKVAAAAVALATGSAQTGDGGLDALIAQSVQRLGSAAEHGAASLEADAIALRQNATNYETADQAGTVP